MRNNLPFFYTFLLIKIYFYTDSQYGFSLIEDLSNFREFLCKRNPSSNFFHAVRITIFETLKRNWNRETKRDPFDLVTWISESWSKTATDVFWKFLNYSAECAKENSTILSVHLFRDRDSIANTFNKFLGIRFRSDIKIYILN